MAKDTTSFPSAFDELGFEAPFAPEESGEQYADRWEDYGESPFSSGEQVVEHRSRRAATAGPPGRLVVDEYPLLRAHRGTKPDLVLRWNDLTGSDTVDVVVHFHGYSGQKASMRLDRDKESISGLDFTDPEGDAAGRTRPTLAILPRGNYFGGQSGIGYNFPALVRPGALQQLIQDALARLAQVTGHARRMGRLILTGHSGGGAPVNAVLAHTNPDEVHVFDGTYSDPSNIIAWAKRRLAGASDAIPPALRVLYIPGSGTQRHAQAIARSVASGMQTAPSLRPFFRVEATPVPHNMIPRKFGWRLLADPGGDLPNARTGVARGREAEALTSAVESPAWEDAPTLREQVERERDETLETLELSNPQPMDSPTSWATEESLAWLDVEHFEPAESEQDQEEFDGMASEDLDLFEPAESSFEDLDTSAGEDEDEHDHLFLADVASAGMPTTESAQNGQEGYVGEDEESIPDRFDEFMDDRDLEWSAGEGEAEDEEEVSLASSDLTPAERKAVEITSTFETGKRGGFYGLSGNFDGQGLSFGLVNWTIGTGSLQPLLRDFATEQPQRWASIFGKDAAGFLEVIRPTGRVAERAQHRFAVEQMNATRLVHGRTIWSIREPWVSYFRSLSEDQAFQNIQVRYVRVLLKRADEFCRAFRMRSERAFTFMFDTVSSHGKKWLTKQWRGQQRRRLAVDGQMQRLRAQYGDDAVPERDILLMIADVLAATSAARWASKVRSRKRWFVTGEHPRALELRGLEPGDAPYTVSAGGSTTRVTSEAPTPSAIGAGDLGATIARVAEQEYTRWHPASGDIHETDSAAVPILQQYYREGVNLTVSAANLRSSAWQQQHPWSAVFISWVMRTAGANGFKHATAHQTYIRAARKNRLDGNTTSPFWAYRTTEVSPAVGDLLCASRQNSGATYDNIAGPQVRPTHCDVVTQVMPGKIRVIGGNVRQNVDAKTIRLRPDGTLALDGTQTRFFAIIRCRGSIGSLAPSPAPPRAAPGPTPPATRLSIPQFVATFTPAARRSQQDNNVPALVTLGQAALESGWGAHAPRFNFFGIKAKATDPADSRQLLRTREVCATRQCKFPEIISITPRSDGRFDYIVRDWFRAYPDAAAAFNAHGQFLARNKRYAEAFAVAGDPYAFAKAVAGAGYATDPSYAQKLTGVMRKIESVV